MEKWLRRDRHIITAVLWQCLSFFFIVGARSAVRINCGSSSSIQINGLTFWPDQHFLGGHSAVIMDPKTTPTSRNASALPGAYGHRNTHDHGQSPSSASPASKPRCCSLFKTTTSSYPMFPLDNSFRYFLNSDAQGSNCYNVPASKGHHLIRLTFARYWTSVVTLADSKGDPSQRSHSAGQSPDRNRTREIPGLQDSSFLVVIEGAPRELIRMEAQNGWHTVEYLVDLADNDVSICFVPVKGVPYVNTIEVQEGLPLHTRQAYGPWNSPMKTIWRINSGGGFIAPSSSSQGLSWAADKSCSSDESPATPSTFVPASDAILPGSLFQISQLSWSQKGSAGTVTESVSSWVEAISNRAVYLPSDLLATVAAPQAGSQHLRYTFELNSNGPALRTYSFVLFFVEPDPRVREGERKLDLFINSRVCIQSFDILAHKQGSPVAVVCGAQVAFSPATSKSLVQLLIAPAAGSVYGAIVSAVEMYRVLPRHLVRETITGEKSLQGDFLSFNTTHPSTSQIHPPPPPTSSPSFNTTALIILLCGGAVFLLLILTICLLWWYQTERRRSSGSAGQSQNNISHGALQDPRSGV